MRQWGGGCGFACGLYIHTCIHAHTLRPTQIPSAFMLFMCTCIHSLIHPFIHWLSPRSLEPFIAVQHVLQKQSFLSISHLLCATHIVPQYFVGGGCDEERDSPPSLGWPCSLCYLLSIVLCPPKLHSSSCLNELPLDSSATPLRPFVSQYAAYGMAGKVTALWGMDPITLPCQRS